MQRSRGLGAFRGERAEEVLLKTFAEVLASHETYEHDALYRECIASLAGCGGAAAKKQWLAFAPWNKWPDGKNIRRIDEVEDITAFIEGALRTQTPDRAETLKRTRDWLVENSGGWDFYGLLRRVWSGTFQVEPETASNWAIDALNNRIGASIEYAFNAPQPVDPNLIRAAVTHLESGGSPDLLRKLRAWDQAQALRIARTRLAMKPDLDGDPGHTILLFLLEFGDASDLPLLDRIAPVGAYFPGDLSGAIRRFRARNVK